MFLLVSGAAASGKTTVARQLSSLATDLICHDHDEVKVNSADERCQTLEEWIQIALTHQATDRDFLLTSHAPLGELLACPSAPQLNGIAAALLDCQDPIRIQRMRDRGIDPRWPPTQHVLNWASWHRMHAWDPQWEQTVITGNGSPEHSYDRWLNWTQADPRWLTTVIDTSQSDVQASLSLINNWADLVRQQTTALALESEWWMTDEG